MCGSFGCRQCRKEIRPRRGNFRSVQWLWSFFIVKMVALPAAVDAMPVAVEDLLVVFIDLTVIAIVQ